MTKDLNNQKKTYFCERINLMRLLKRTIQWTIGIICGLYFCLQIAMHIPPIQKWAGSAASQVLHGMWDWDISIGRIRLGLWNRIIIDDIKLKDKQDSILLMPRVWPPNWKSFHSWMAKSALQTHNFSEQKQTYIKEANRKTKLPVHP